MKMPITPTCFLFMALPCEAKPIIESYRLKKETSIHAFSIFRNNNVILTVTGLGKNAMAAGVAYSQALFPTDNPSIMVNIGIAGHFKYSIGSVFLADKVTDADSGRRFYPPFVLTPPCPTQNLITFSKPQPSYPQEALCDMEASAFYEVTTRFTTSELIHCLKIVSDNDSTSVENIEPKMVSKLIGDNLPTIDLTLKALSKLAEVIVEPELPELLPLLNRYRFTVNEQMQLKKLLLRQQVAHGQINVDFTAKTGSEYLSKLKENLDRLAFYL